MRTRERKYLQAKKSTNRTLIIADADNDPGWLCNCGHSEDSEFHCTHCGGQPPWGCDCSVCVEDYPEDYPYENDPFQDPDFLRTSEQEATFIISDDNLPF